MPKTQSLDEFIAKKAAEFADHVRNAAALADTEEEIRIDVETQLAFIKKEAGIDFEKIQGKHEFTIAKGRVDSLYTRVLIEYKNPSDPNARLGPRLDSPGSKKVVEQIKSRFRGLKDEFGHSLGSLFGVGLDGKHFIFVRFRDNKWDIQEPVEVAKHSAERFLWALYNLGQKGKPFSPEYLAADFGAMEGSVAVEGVRALYEAIATTTHPKAQTFFQQWKILFGEVCGYDVDDPSERIKKLAEFYGLPSKRLKPAEMLFALHSYYALFMKLLASEVVAFFHKLPTPLKAMLTAPTGAKLMREMEELEAGSIFRHLNITNFLEGDLFAWYTVAWKDSIEGLVRRMVAKLDDYNPGTMSENPAASRDLLKKLYQELFPKSVRHDLGEYYTPDWLANHVLNEVGYAGDPERRILDPACGSGTFLVMIINRIKAWFEKNRERCAYDEGELCAKILTNVVGFDLNPLAVMAARTNYLVAIRDLIGRIDTVEIPVYLCDSLLTPKEYGTFVGAKLDHVKELKTATGSFFIPTDVVFNREHVAKYAHQLERCVRDEYSSAEFVQRCKEEGMELKDDQLHQELFDQLVRLAKANRNGVWARIIKNAFAPLFVGRADYVVGNPPWVNWESLPKEYRDTTNPLWDSYHLRERATRGARLGNVKKELSALFLYVAMDHYLRKDGTLGFVITQSVFKSGANEGFRRFKLNDKQPLAVKRVCDMSLCLPFENAINRTATVTLEKGRPTEYPVPYKMWVPTIPRSYVIEGELEEVLEGFDVRDWLAAPVEPSVTQSTWLTAARGAFPALQKVIGDRSPTTMNRTYAGSCTWLNGVYWVESLKSSDRTTMIRNMGDIGRNKVDIVTAQVETPLLFPLLRGRDVQAWRGEPSAAILVPHDRSDFASPIELADMKRLYPGAFSFLKLFEETLRARSGYKQLHKSREEFYVIGNVGGYTLAPYKVVFKDLSEVFQCAVIGPDKGTHDPVVPDHTVLFLAAASEDEAHFLCAILNSIPVRVALYGASVGVQTQRYFPTDVSRVRLPQFNPQAGDHQSLVKLSKKCHAEAAMGCQSQKIDSFERELAVAASPTWGISDAEITAMLSAYEEIRNLRNQRSQNSKAEAD